MLWNSLSTILRTAAALMLCLGGAANAMYVNPHGTGQVLLFPYYTVNGGQATLISIVNTTARAKSLKVEFREGHNARQAIDFNLFLGPYDSWTATIGSDSETSFAYVHTRDETCTAPDMPEWDSALGGGWRVSMFDYAYTADNEDSGPTNALRTREGYVAVFELAQLAGALAAAVDVDGPRQCQVVRDIDPASVNLSVPGGGLAGRFAIVDVAQGTLLGGSATAIADYSNIVLYTDTTSLLNYIAIGNSAPGFARASVFANGRVANLDYSTSAPNNAVDAVSAVLAADSLQADITREASVGSFSEWVLTAPTKWVYTDNQILGEPLNTTQPGIPPYEEIFGAARAGGSCSRFEARGHDREGHAISFAPDTPISGNNDSTATLPDFSLCRSTDVVHFGPVPASGTTPVLGSRLGVKVWNPQPVIDSGHAILSFSKRNDGTPRILRPDMNGNSVRGLPLIGFEAIKYVNGNVLPGVLANYTYALPLLPVVTCTNALGAVRECP